jgi:hypothetical protein
MKRRTIGAPCKRIQTQLLMNWLHWFHIFEIGLFVFFLQFGVSLESFLGSSFFTLTAFFLGYCISCAVACVEDDFIRHSHGAHGTTN